MHRLLAIATVLAITFIAVSPMASAEPAPASLQVSGTISGKQGETIGLIDFGPRIRELTIRGNIIAGAVEVTMEVEDDKRGTRPMSYGGDGPGELAEMTARVARVSIRFKTDGRFHYSLVEK